MAEDLYNDGLSDHAVTIEPFNFHTVQDPELQEEVSVQLKFKRYGGYLSLNEMNIEDLNFSLPTPDQINGVSLWLDAADTSTISLGTDKGVNTWTNKMDSSKMHGAPDKPETNSPINGINALIFGVKDSTHGKGCMHAKR